MAADFGPGALALDFLTHVINVHWGSPVGFLYSGADGMFVSKDGEIWEEAPSSVPATSLAWVDGVWVACGPSGTWRSEDGAKTWQSSGPHLRQVAAMKPAGVDSKGKPLPGMFAGWGDDDDNGLIYTSSDGKSWSVALTIPNSVGESSEFITGLSGCGGAFFVGTVSSPNITSTNTAKFYSSFDGGGFSDHTVADGTFWNGDIENIPAEFVNYTPGGVGYDKETKMYLATIGKEQVARNSGVQNSYMQVSESASGSFNEGTQVEQATLVSGTGDFISVYSSVAGGEGTFVGGSALRQFGGSGVQTGGEVRVHWLPGGSAQTLESYTGATSDEFIGSFCFKPKKDTEESTDSTDSLESGVFACVAFGEGAAGGVYIATAGGSFRKTHAGQGIRATGGGEVEGAGQPAGAVAVGKIKFLGSTDAGL